MKIIQLTDLHLVPEGQKIHEIDPGQRLEQALANIKLRHPDLDLLVITGDLCNEGDTPSYRLLRELLEKYQLNRQLVLGNHDQREPFRGVFPETAIDPNGFIQSKIQSGGNVYLFLDTLQEGQVAGSYCEKRQDWLRNELKSHSNDHVYVFLHHPPFKVGMKEMDNCNLADGEILGEILNSHANIKHLFCGLDFLKVNVLSVLHQVAHESSVQDSRQSLVPERSSPFLFLATRAIVYWKH